ncbi:MSC_0619 family F1-like ATPase alpha subunit [Mycoplasmopsis columbina]|uniref:MSC_0619 family F1-like ATPase alpha subunit n=1 Tax=Mycoplasmopsis columbina TaxID=114881 RepID=UPI0004A7621B|nr:ATP F0F1 synthase subunit alpha [Mycoplasmopsis columbina]VEU76663.1 ATP synthase F0F1 subunit alpha [Mycoplasmopsis columbina]
MNNKLYISAIHDYIIQISGDYKYAQNEIFEVKNNRDFKLMVISANENVAFCLANSDSKLISVGQEVEVSDQNTKIVTNKSYYGKIIDVFGDVIFPKMHTSNDFYQNRVEILKTENNLMTYQPLEEQLYTGYAVIDLLIPIGKGQRELIIGDRKTGKSFIALNTIINQKNKGVKCIYVAIGQTQSQVASIYQTLKEHGADSYTIIVNAPSEKPYEQYLAPYVGMAHAENISQHDDVLIVFDDLSKHANIYREIALLTNKPVLKEAFPGDMFYAHSRLLERSGKFKDRKSITALPIVQTIDNDITSLIASNVISITDGQIVTNSDLFASNKYPAVDVNLSVSRIGSRVQNKLIAQTAKVIATLYRAFKKQMKLAALKYDLNDDINNLMISGLQIEKLFNQKGITSYDANEMFLTSKLIQWNLLNQLTDKNIEKAIKFLIAFVKKDSVSQDIIKNSIENTLKNDELAKNYFAFILQTYSNMYDLNWKVSSKEEFVELDKNLITQTHEELEGAN